MQGFLFVLFCCSCFGGGCFTIGCSLLGIASYNVGCDGCFRLKDALWLADVLSRVFLAR